VDPAGYYEHEYSCNPMWTAEVFEEFSPQNTRSRVRQARSRCGRVVISKPCASRERMKGVTPNPCRRSLATPGA